MRRRLLGAAIAPALVVGLAGCTGPSPAAAPAPRASASTGAAEHLPPPGTATTDAPQVSEAVRQGCPGAHVPSGFAIDHGLPHPTTAPYSPVTLFNPQSVANFVLAAAEDPGNSPAARRCLMELGGTALVEHGELRRVDAPGAASSQALVFPYAFPFSANPSVPTLQPGWVSGLAQGTALSAFAQLNSLTGDGAWLRLGAEVVRSFAIPQDRGGFRTDDDGVTWFQEYPTSPHSYVLNGHLAAVIALARWADLTGDPQARSLATAGLAGARRLLPSYEVTLPQGVLSSYDLLRGRTPAAALRVATDAAATATVSLAGPGPSAAPVPVPVQPLRYLSDDLAGPGPAQDIPASSLVPGAHYRITFRGRLTLPPGQAGTAGALHVAATCPNGPVALRAEATIRTQQASPYDVEVTLPPQHCGLRVGFGPAEPDGDPSRLVVTDVAVHQVLAPTGSTATLPLPVSTVQQPDVSIALTYRGQGRLEAWREGRWITLEVLEPSTAARTVVVPLPAWAQGRTLNWGYHTLQTAQVAWISTHLAPGDPVFAGYGKRWQQLAPADGALEFG